MPGIEHDALSDIQAIKRLLEVYQPGFAFLKELIQNADDAEAPHLRMRWHPGLPDAQHPLLRGPALVSLNDGQFTPEDKHSLLRMGLGNKGGNSGKIGKFGLGTKSIFHVAEAFFFLNSNKNPDLRNILNPWSPRFHKEWDSVSDSDWNRLEQTCSEIGEGLAFWFAMWIPLRKLDQLEGLVAIRNGTGAFPGESKECPKEMVAPFHNTNPRLGLVLPLLRFLDRIEFEGGNNIQHEIVIDRQALQVTQDQTTTQYRIASVCIPARAEEWQNLPAWPKVFRIREDASESVMPDKAEWSHAIVLALSPTGRAKSYFRIYWSVFLPVGNEPYLEVELPGTPRDISLFLHGYFFLNDSRTSIQGVDKHFPPADRNDSNGICLEWNRALACDDGGLLPALLPRLGDWLDQGDLNQSEIGRCVEAIRDSPLLINLGETLTRNGSLLYALLDGAWAWRWIPKEIPTALVPAISDPSLLDELRSLTNSVDAELKVIFAVVCTGYRGIPGKLAPFDGDCLTQLRRIIGEQELTDEQAKLIHSIIRATLGDADLPTEWQNVSLYNVRPCGDIIRRRMPASDLDAILKAGNLFASDDYGLAALMGKAGGIDEVPCIAGSALPPGCSPPNLTYERAAKWITDISVLSTSADERLPLFKRLTKRDRFTDLELSALRYLAHSHPDHRDDGEPLFFHSDGNNALWNRAFDVVLSPPNHSWRLIDPRFGQALNDSLKERIGIKSCTRETWADLLESLGEVLPSINFSAVPRNVIEWVLQETPDERLDCLKPLKLHCFSNTEMVSASDDTVWLDAGLIVPEDLTFEWRSLRESARILKASPDKKVALREQLLFGERILDSSGALKRSAESANPEQYEDLILHLLGHGTPSKEAIISLTKSSWLRLSDGTTISPNLILHLEGLDQILANVLKSLGSCSERSSLLVSDKTRKSKGWETLSTQIFASTGTVLDRLTDKFNEPPNSLAIGFQITSEQELNDWISVVSMTSDPHLYQARSLLSELSSREDWRGHALEIAKRLGQPFKGDCSVQLYLERLLDLKRIHDSSNQDAKGTVTKVFGQYLKGSLASGVWHQLKQEPSLLLMGGDGKWRSPSALAAPCAGVRKSALLNMELSDALKLGQEPRPTAQAPAPGRHTATQNNISSAASAKALRTLLKPFSTRLQEKAVAILPALLGTDPETDQVAQELLGGIEPSLIRDELIPDDIKVDDQLGGSLRERSNEWSFRIEMIHGETVILESIAGTLFDAPLAGSTETVFLPNPNGQLLRWAGGNLQILCVAEPSRFEPLSDRKLRDIILQSISDLMWWAYTYRPSNLGEVFEKYEGLGQLSLGVARQEILRSADTQLQLLGVSPPGLDEARDLALEARARLSEADSGLGNEERLRKLGEDFDRKARALFLEKLDGDVEVHSALLEGVRQRIARQQYEIDSIPFEILQNADDAAGELLRHAVVSPEDLPYVSTFVVQSTGDHISFHYGGRPINSACGLTGAAANRYKRDLVKMLLLNGSDKNTSSEENEVTGKFGLGFKSVFLLTDTPRIVSGKLSFVILGGIWPKEFDPQDFYHTDTFFGTYAQRTSLELIADSSRIEKSLSRFRSLAPWLPVFTRNIRTVLVSTDLPPTHFQWDFQPIEDCRNIRVGHITTKNGERIHLEFTDGHLQWLFQIDHGKIAGLPEEVPWLWVTAPTRERPFGFALNAPFALDPGRTCLSKQHDHVEATNIPLFIKAADLLWNAFGQLVESPKALEAIEANDPYSFWESVWHMMSSLPQAIGTPVGIEYLSRAVWPKDGVAGYSGLLRFHAALPNGLHRAIKTLTTTNQLSVEIRGWLGGNLGCRLLGEAIEKKLTPFDNPVACCSSPIAEVLRKRIGMDLCSFGLIELMSVPVGKAFHVSPDRACLVGAALWSEEPDMENLNFAEVLESAEALEIESKGQAARFLSMEGTWEPAGNLMASHNHISAGDEMMRASFAPPSRVLAKSYGKTGARIFFCFRERLRADSDEMARWILAQGANRTSIDALIYLASGELRDEVATHLGPQWFMAARESPSFQNLDTMTAQAIEFAFDVAAVRNKRNILQGDSGWAEPEPPPEPSERLFLSPSDLETCWNLQEAIELFTICGPLGRLVTGKQSNTEQLVEMLLSAETLTGKSAWYRLLCLGCTLGMPLGIRPLNLVQRLWHEDLTEDFWKATIPPNLQDSEDSEFNSNLDVYFEKRIHMLFRNENASGENAAFWRRVFYDFRKMHHFVFRNHLPETVLEFANRDEADGNSLIQFLRSGQIPDSLQYPGTARFRGVIGQSMKAPLLFVMRELRRLNLLDARFDSACFYMNSPARRTARRLGWIDYDSRASGDFATLVVQSEQVHEQMWNELPELAPFFDLPLQLYAHKHPR